MTHRGRKLTYGEILALSKTDSEVQVLYEMTKLLTLGDIWRWEDKTGQKDLAMDDLPVGEILDALVESVGEDVLGSDEEIIAFLEMRALKVSEEYLL